MIERIADLVNADADLVRRGRHLSTTFLIETGEQCFLIKIIEGRIVAVSPTVPGRVIKVLVEDNQHVDAGQLIVELDPAPAQARLDEAKASQALAETTLNALREVAEMTKVTIESSISQAEVGVVSAQAALEQTKAEAAAAQARGLAEAEATKAKGLAEAEAIKARAAALAENQEAVVAQQIAEQWPEIVEAASKAFGNVDHMVVFNGADGVSDLLAKALSLGGTGLGLARQLMDAMGKPTEKELDEAARKNGELKLSD